MTDQEFNSLMVQLGMENRRKVVKSLLAGNDVQCFTTQQYAEAYHRICHKDDQKHREGWINWLTGLAPKHLRSLGMKEVKPDVWAPELTLEGGMP